MRIMLFSSMNEEERKEWLNEFQQWVSVDLPMLESGDIDESSFEKGLQLISAFSFTRGVVNEAQSYRNYASYIAPVRRLSGKIIAELQKYTERQIDLTDPSLLRPHVGRPTKEEQAARALLAEQERRAKEEKELSLFKHREHPVEAAGIASGFPGGSLLHLDQLRWLMSAELQEEVSRIREYRSIAAEAATIAKNMAENGVDEEQVSSYAKKAAEYTDRYESIYAQVDKEMAFVYVRLKEDKTYIESMKAKNVDPSEIRTFLRPYWDKVDVSDRDQLKQKVVNFIKANDPRQASIRAKEEEKAKKVRECIKYITRRDKKSTLKRIEGLKNRLKVLESLVGAEEANQYKVFLTAAEQEFEKSEQD